MKKKLHEKVCCKENVKDRMLILDITREKMLLIDIMTEQVLFKDMKRAREKKYCYRIIHEKEIW